MPEHFRHPTPSSQQPAQHTRDPITRVEISLIELPLAHAISDAKVLTGRQRPLTSVSLVFAEITTHDGNRGLGFAYTLRTGGRALYELSTELAPLLIGESVHDIQRLWEKLSWAVASVGQSGLAMHAIAPFDIALWDLKAKRARLPLAQLLGAFRDSVPVYNTSGGYLSTPIGEVLDNASASLESGIGGIKIKIGQPDFRQDLHRLEAIRQHLGDSTPLMVDVNQQWDRQTAHQVGPLLTPFHLTWIEEPLSTYDHAGYAALSAAIDTPISTGEMLTSVREHAALLQHGSIAFLQPDAPRIGGITPFLQVMNLASHYGVALAPHFVMEIHIHLAAAYPSEPWVEHFDWLSPLFNEPLAITHGRLQVPERDGLGLSLSEQAAGWTQHRSVCTTPLAAP